MKERPILFDGEMVRAVLDDRKTQTRRVIKPQPIVFPNGVICSNDHKPINCPYGQPGDRLWVRETFMPRALDLSISEVMTPHYKADPCGSRPEWGGLWKPSIHMPRWASRITLEIESVRVERVQEISEGDAIAEGIHETIPLLSGKRLYLRDPKGTRSNDVGETAKEAFALLWESIYFDRGFGWNLNPWVWVITFRRVE